MAHSLSRYLVLAAAALAVVVALGMQSDGRGDMRRTPIEREGEVVDLSRVSLDLGGGVTMDFVLIPAGRFLMGSPKEEKERDDDEGPQHEVTISRSFYLGKYEVTQEQYQRIMGKNPSCFSADGRGKQAVAGLDTRCFPVEMVSWNDATTFCDKLSARDRKRRRFRLPTEVEWEYACRAGTKTPFHFGDSLNGDQANCNGEIPYGMEKKGAFLTRTCRVGSYRPTLDAIDINPPCRAQRGHFYRVKTGHFYCRSTQMPRRHALPAKPRGGSQDRFPKREIALAETSSIRNSIGETRNDSELRWLA